MQPKISKHTEYRVAFLKIYLETVCCVISLFIKSEIKVAMETIFLRAVLTKIGILMGLSGFETDKHKSKMAAL